MAKEKYNSEDEWIHEGLKQKSWNEIRVNDSWLFLR
jgi:hypothetical protein